MQIEGVRIVVGGFIQGVQPSAREIIRILEEAVIQNELAKFNLKTFFNVPDFSSAYNGFISLAVAQYLTFEPGFFLFLGKDEKYFTPNKTDNNNTVYFKLKYEFF